MKIASLLFLTILINSHQFTFGQLTDVYCQSFETPFTSSSGWDGSTNTTAMILQPNLSSQNVDVYTKHDGSGYGRIRYGIGEGPGISSTSSVCSDSTGASVFTNLGNTNISRNMSLIFEFSYLEPGEYYLSFDYKYKKSGSASVYYEMDDTPDIFGGGESIPLSYDWTNLTFPFERHTGDPWNNPTLITQVDGSLDITFSISTANSTNETIIIDNILLQKDFSANIADKDSYMFTLYPNPSNGVVNINLGNLYTGEIIIYDLLGNKVRQLAINNNQMSVDIKNLRSSTVFILKIVDSNNNVIATKKLLTQL